MGVGREGGGARWPSALATQLAMVCGPSSIVSVSTVLSALASAANRFFVTSISFCRISSCIFCVASSRAFFSFCAFSICSFLCSAFISAFVLTLSVPSGFRSFMETAFTFFATFCCGPFLSIGMVGAGLRSRLPLSRRTLAWHCCCPIYVTLLCNRLQVPADSTDA